MICKCIYVYNFQQFTLINFLCSVHAWINLKDIFKRFYYNLKPIELFQNPNKLPWTLSNKTTVSINNSFKNPIPRPLEKALIFQISFFYRFNSLPKFVCLPSANLITRLILCSAKERKKNLDRTFATCPDRKRKQYLPKLLHELLCIHKKKRRVWVF